MTPKHSFSISFMVLACVVLWATEYTLVGYIVKSIAPVWIVAIRTCIAVLILSLYVRLTGNKLPSLKDKSWFWYGGMGVIGMTIPFYLIAKGEVLIDSGLAAILVGVTPLFTVILAHFFVASERLNTLKSIGFVIGFIGMALLFLPKTYTGMIIENWQAQALLLLAALGYATTTVLGKRAPNIPASVGANIMLIGAAISALTGAVLSGVPHPFVNAMPPPQALIALLALSIGATALANIFYLRLIQLRGPGLIAKINYMVPAFSVLAGIVFLHESFSLRSTIALGIILAGLVIVGYGERQQRAD